MTLVLAYDCLITISIFLLWFWGLADYYFFCCSGILICILIKRKKTNFEIWMAEGDCKGKMDVIRLYERSLMRNRINEDIGYNSAKVRILVRAAASRKYSMEAELSPCLKIPKWDHLRRYIWKGDWKPLTGLCETENCQAAVSRKRSVKKSPGKNG